MEYERNMSVLRRMITYKYTLTPTPTRKLACRAGVFLTKAYIDRGRHHENIWKMGGGGGGRLAGIEYWQAKQDP